MKQIFTLLFIALLTLCLSSFLPAQETKSKRPKVGVVLSGGGAKGFAHIGALKVLSEAGVPIDYIGGTSMGGIMGGLYALGYSADSLEKLVLKQDWVAVLSDDIPRPSLSMKEKEQEEKYFFSLPMSERKIHIPLGLVSGQAVFNILSYYGSPGYQYKSFDDFPIPFFCIAADMETGESAILNEPPLPAAMRATMAIPTVFSPVDLNNRLLVDGGLLNNFPVQEVVDMGADIIIGIDVQGKLYTKKELNSFLKILDQSSNFLRMPLYEKALSLTDIYIKPDLAGYGVSSFNDADTIIKLGEIAAREMMPELLALVNKLKEYDDFESPPERNAQPLDNVLIRDVKITGLKKVPEEFITRHLKKSFPAEIGMEEIISSVDKLYATKGFYSIFYHLEPMDKGGYRLHLDFHEKQGADLRVGINYNTDLRAAFFLNLTARNFLIPSDRLSLSLDIGDNSGFEADYFIDRGWKPGPGLTLKAFTLDVPVFDGNVKTASFSFSSVTTQLYAQSNIHNFSVLGVGAEIEYSSLKSNVFEIDVDNVNDFNFNLVAYFKLDNLDRKVFPTTGSKLDADFKFVTNVRDSLGVKADPLVFATATYLHAVPLRPKLTLIPQFYGGSLISHGREILPKYQTFMGGLTDKYGYGLFQFVGLEFMQITDLNTAIGRVDLQYEVLKNVFATVKYNIGFRSEDLTGLFTQYSAVNGIGLSVGYKTPIGPLEISVMNSDYSGKWITYFNFGYMF